MNNQSSKFEIPDSVTRAVVDAWKVKPPCELSREHSYCHHQCPYFYECNSEDQDYDTT